VEYRKSFPLNPSVIDISAKGEIVRDLDKGKDDDKGKNEEDR
jgi:hypothetical protein